MQRKLAGVFFTHLHIDHVSGMSDIPNDVPLYVGKSEATENDWLNLLFHGATNQILRNKQALKEWNFQPAPKISSKASLIFLKMAPSLRSALRGIPQAALPTWSEPRGGPCCRPADQRTHRAQGSGALEQEGELPVHQFGVARV